MSILTVENIGKSFREKPLFEGVSFGLEANERVGLIGANGSGKTTLLRMIAGQETPDTGRIYRSGDPVVGYLPQNPPFDPDASVLDTIFSSNSETMRLLHDYEEACLLLAADDAHQAALLEKMTDLSAKLEAAGAWGLETDAKIVLDKLGITDTGAIMGLLSGGGRKRVAMARALIERPDLLMLDEPTNHLDADAVAWLEEYLGRYSGALLLVTHDRYFLDRVTRRIIEIDRGQVRSYAGNYGYYLERKEEEEERLEVEERKRRMLVRQELAWLRRGAKARATKQKARIERATALMSGPRATKREQIDIALGSRRLGRKILELHGVSKSYGDTTLIRNFTHIMQPGERVGIIGPNGAGKTTLLEMIVGNIRPDEGRIETGDTVVIGYYDQESHALEDDRRVIDDIRLIAETIRAADGATITASQMLERFLFPPSLQYTTIGALSGGERRRLYLLRLLMGSPNVLVLDEPTNDFDIPTLQALEEYLDGFDGCVIVVSHDRYFLDRTVDHLFRFEGNGVAREYPGAYSAYLEIRAREASQQRELQFSTRTAAKEGPIEESPSPIRQRSGPLSYKERKKLDALEQAIEQAEQKKKEIETRLASADYRDAVGLAEELQAIQQQIERDMEHWSELAGRVESGGW